MDAERAARLARIRTLIDLGRFAEAETRCRSSLAVDSADPVVLCLLAQSFLGLGASGAAKQAAVAAIRAAPGDAWPHRLASIACMGLSEVEQATDSARVAVRMDPFSATSHAQLAFALSTQRQSLFEDRLLPHDKHRLEEAARAARRAIAIDAHAVDGHHALGRILLAQRRKGAARDAYARAAAIDPTSAALRVEIARADLAAPWRRLTKLVRVANANANLLAQNATPEISQRRLDLTLFATRRRIHLWLAVVVVLECFVALPAGHTSAYWICQAILSLPLFGVVHLLYATPRPLRRYFWRSQRQPIRVCLLADWTLILTLIVLSACMEASETAALLSAFSLVVVGLLILLREGVKNEFLRLPE